ncbi:MAG TPA: hypothetical protein ENI23_05405 [bacterium]|nr:hypothetical protein [bacterium]
MPYERDVDIRVQPNEDTLVRTSNIKNVRSTKDGAIYAAEWIQSLIDAGHGFSAGIGLLSAAEALPAAAITTLRPQLWIRVPTNTTIIPLYGAIEVEDTGATTAFEVAIGKVGSDVGNGTSSAADFGPVNMSTGADLYTSKCTARQEATGDVTADADDDLWRAFKSEDNATTPATAGGLNFEWDPRGRAPKLVGPATLIMNIGSSSAPIVTARFQWVEFAS